MGFTGVAMIMTAGAACSSSIPDDGGINLPRRPDGSAVDSAVAADSAVSCKDLKLKVGDPAACDQCAKEKCCAEVMACNNDADCKALQACIDPCAQTDYFCILSCQDAHPKGNELLTSVGSCVQNECKSECPSMQADGGNLFGDSGL